MARQGGLKARCREAVLGGRQSQEEKPVGPRGLTGAVGGPLGSTSAGARITAHFWLVGAAQL